MKDSITYFWEKGINNLEKIEENFFKNPNDIASFVNGVKDEVIKLGLLMIKDSFEAVNEMLINDRKRKNDWYIDKHVNKELITSLGNVRFRKTLFVNKNTKERCFLFDDVVGINPHVRMTEDAEAKMLEEAVQTSYRRGGEEASILSMISKQTVKNKLHSLAFPYIKPKEKKVVKTLFIDADEDHVSLQYKCMRGDLKKDNNGRKNNCKIAKLVYVYEGIEKEHPKSKRHKLINPVYFVSSEDETNEDFWKRINRYIEEAYDTTKLKTIYINGDGANWIKAGTEHLMHSTHVIDEFHLKKYINKMCRHMKDSKDDVKKAIKDCIMKNEQTDFENLAENLKGYAKTEKELESINDGRDFILSNWMAAKVRLSRRNKVKGCSAEGHVSHVLSSRMSSRPMGWSYRGSDNMANLRAYYYNDGDMLKLVRFQKKEEKLPVAAGAEEVILSATQALKKKENVTELERYVDTYQAHLSLQTKKQLYFQHQIWLD